MAGMKNITDPRIMSLGEHKDLRKTPRMFPPIREKGGDMYANFDAWSGTDDDERYLGIGDAVEKFNALGTFAERNKKREKPCTRESSGYHAENASSVYGYGQLENDCLRPKSNTAPSNLCHTSPLESDEPEPQEIDGWSKFENADAIYWLCGELKVWYGKNIRCWQDERLSTNGGIPGDFESWPLLKRAMRDAGIIK